LKYHQHWIARVVKQKHEQKLDGGNLTMDPGNWNLLMFFSILGKIS
jgi:hypothetical protein